MSYQDKIELYLREIQELEKTFREAQGKEILPLSFFSSSFDILNRLKTGIYEIEAAQLQMMQEDLKKRESEWFEINEVKEAGEIVELKPVEEKPLYKKPENEKFADEKPAPGVNVLADTIGRKINADFGKSLSLNDRFMFQRDLFQGDANKMNQAFVQLDTFQSLNDVLEFLNEKYTISWNSDSGIALRELLEKRFA